MLQMLVITMREGIEAFLIVAITLAYLRKTQRRQLIAPVYWGTGGALFASALAAWLFAQAENQPLWEGLLALVAALLVVTMVIYMMRAAKRIGAEIRGKVDAAAAKAGFTAKLGVFAFVLLMIVREGMEMAAIVASLALQTGMADMLAGALLGIFAAAGLAWAWARYGQRVNLARLFQVTSVFLLLFALQLVFYAFHELTEANVLPIDNEYWHVATEPWAPEGQYGPWVSYALVLVPALWLAFAEWRDRVRVALPAARAGRP